MYIRTWHCTCAKVTCNFILHRMTWRKQERELMIPVCSTDSRHSVQRSVEILALFLQSLRHTQLRIPHVLCTYMYIYMYDGFQQLPLLGATTYIYMYMYMGFSFMCTVMGWLYICIYMYRDVCIIMICLASCIALLAQFVFKLFLN